MKILITIDTNKWKKFYLNDHATKLFYNIIKKRICKIMIPKKYLTKISIETVYNNSIVECSNIENIRYMMLFIYDYFICHYPNFKITYVETNRNASFYTNVPSVFFDKNEIKKHSSFFRDYFIMLKDKFGEDAHIGFFYDFEYSKLEKFTILREVSFI